MLNNLFTIPRNHKVLFLVLIPMLAFVLCYVLFPIILKDYYGNAYPPYVLLDMEIVSRNLFWIFETAVFFINLWVFSWKINTFLRNSLMIFIFLLGWLATIADFRAPSAGIVWGTFSMCAFYYLLVPVFKIFLSYFRGQLKQD